MPKVSEEHKRQREQEILHAAKKVFIRKGFERTTMKDVVDESGFSRGGVYMYFSDTEEMYHRIIDQETNEALLTIKNKLNSSASIWTILEEFLNQLEFLPFKDENSMVPVQWEYAISSLRQSKRKQFVSNRFTDIHVFFTSLLNEGVSRKEFTPIQSTSVIALVLIGMIDSISLYSQLSNDEVGKSDEQIKAIKIYLKSALNLDGVDTDTM
ncbi:TetR/AcrR family transcriptional regulator [Bacillus sp. JJ722]|uniref:TetR/AcrR family transcriptional regulator n=1 Tax=Bacillus sp. JJ722 TaxID=3122973 RepID=UPI002FFDCF4E